MNTLIFIIRYFLNHLIKLVFYRLILMKTVLNSKQILLRSHVPDERGIRVHTHPKVTLIF